MMYVVPHGDRLEDYQLPADPTASPMPMTSLGFLKRLGSYLFGVSILGTVAHFLAFGQQGADDES